jgi:hypothetical protein
MVLLVGFSLIAWLNLFVVVYELHLDGPVLTWRSGLRSGEIRVETIHEVRNVVPGPWPFVRIGVGAGPSLFVQARGPFGSFIDRLTEENPRVLVDPRSRRSWQR